MFSHKGSYSRVLLYYVHQLYTQAAVDDWSWTKKVGLQQTAKPYSRASADGGRGRRLKKRWSNCFLNMTAGDSANTAATAETRSSGIPCDATNTRFFTTGV